MSFTDRRSLVLGGVAASLQSIIPAAAQVTSWHEAERTLRGLNILQPFGWVIANHGTYKLQPYVNGGSFEHIMPEERRKLIRQVGFDFVRMPVDFGPLLSAPNDAALDRLINEVMNGVHLYLASGLKVLIVQFSPADLTVWPTTTDGVAGSAFRRLVAVWQRFASITSTRTNPEEVAIEPFNEPPFASEIKTDPWLVQQKFLFDHVRSALPAHLIVVTADSFSAIDRLVLLNPKDYDSKTSFKFSGYEPLQLSHQGEGFWRHIHRLTFPPEAHAGGKARAIFDFAAAVNSDKNLSWLEKIRSIHKFTNSKTSWGIDTYFDTPCDRTFIFNRIKAVTTWAESHGVSTRRLIVGEFGARGDYDGLSPDGTPIVVEAGSRTTQATFCEAWRREMEFAKLGAWCVHEIGGPAGWNLALGKPPWTFRSDLLAALGLNV